MSTRRSDPRRAQRRARTIALVVALLAAGYAAWRWLNAIGGPTALGDQVGAWAPLISVPLHVVLAATPFPSEVVGVANGSIYGLWQGTLFGWISWWSAAMIVYTLARRGTRDPDPEALPTRTPKWLTRIPISHPAVLIIVRQLPFCFHAINALAGATGVTVRRQAATAGVSNLLYAFITAAAGAELINTW